MSVQGGNAFQEYYLLTNSVRRNAVKYENSANINSNA